MAELEINGTQYRTAKLNAVNQFHIMRRLMPILSGMGMSYAQIAGLKNQDQNETTKEAQVVGALGPVADIISKMSDTETEYVINKCLSVVVRNNGRDGQNNWVRIIGSAGQIQFEDIDMGSMLQLVMAVIQENLGDFFNTAPDQSSAGA